MNIEVSFQDLERAISHVVTTKSEKPTNFFKALKDKAVSAATSSVKFSSPSEKQIQVGVGPAKVAFEVRAIKDNDITLRTSGAVDAVLKLLPQDKLDGLVQHNDDNSITIALKAALRFITGKVNARPEIASGPTPWPIKILSTML